MSVTETMTTEVLCFPLISLKLYVNYQYLYHPKLANRETPYLNILEYILNDS